MVKILQATSRGQITLPKSWRDGFDTNYYRIEVEKEKLIITPLAEKKAFEDALADSWKEYQHGKFIAHEDLKKKYGL